MTPFTLDENVLSETLFGNSEFEMDKAFNTWKNTTFQNFPNKIVQILNISFTKNFDDYSRRNYCAMNIIYRIGG